MTSTEDIRDASVDVAQAISEGLGTLAQADPVTARLMLFGFASTVNLLLQDAKQGSKADDLRCILKTIAAISASSAVNEGVDGVIGELAGAATLVALGSDAAIECLSRGEPVRLPTTPLEFVFPPSIDIPGPFDIIPPSPFIPPFFPIGGVPVIIPGEGFFDFIPPLQEILDLIPPPPPAPPEGLVAVCILQALISGRDPGECLQ